MVKIHILGVGKRGFDFFVEGTSGSWKHFLYLRSKLHLIFNPLFFPTSFCNWHMLTGDDRQTYISHLGTAPK